MWVTKLILSRVIFTGLHSSCLPRTTGCPAGSCTVEDILPGYRKMCDNRPLCFAYAHVDEDPCPDVSKYLKIVYSCEQKGGVFFSGLL